MLILLLCIVCLVLLAPVFLGSSRRYSSEESDAEKIARYGNELTVETLERLIKTLKGEE